MKKMMHSCNTGSFYAFVLVLMCFTVVACSNKKEQPKPTDTSNQNKTTTAHNTLSVQEKEAGWTLLFDGKSTEHWRGSSMDHFPEAGWVVRDSTLTVVETNGRQEGGAGDIITKKKYSEFELTLDFRLTKGGNSGIKYYALENTYKEGTTLGLEYQILDDKRHPDAKKGRDGNRTVSSLYDLIPAADDKPINPPGQWNHARIVAKDNHVEHWLNGEKVLEYDRDSEHFKELIAQSKYKDFENFGLAKEGHILLQDHGNEVSFRNIKIRDLSE